MRAPSGRGALTAAVRMRRAGCASCAEAYGSLALRQGVSRRAVIRALGWGAGLAVAARFGLAARPALADACDYYWFCLWGTWHVTSWCCEWMWTIWGPAQFCWVDSISNTSWSC